MYNIVQTNITSMRKIIKKVYKEKSFPNVEVSKLELNLQLIQWSPKQKQRELQFAYFFSVYEK